VLVSLIGTFVFKQRLDTPAIIGITLILAGVVIMNVFSKASVE
jgi:small multidrug resistance pump